MGNIKNISIRHITSGSVEYQKVWELREKVLRKPLGLSLKNEDLSRDKINDIIIAEADKKLIGCVFMQPLSVTEIQLRAMAVYRKWQGQGVGTMLVQEGEKFAIQNGFSKIILHARKVAIPFYLKMNYKIVSDEFIEVGIPHFMMEKQIFTGWNKPL